MKVIVMKLEITQLRCKHINTYNKHKCDDILSYKVSRKGLINNRIHRSRLIVGLLYIYFG